MKNQTTADQLSSVTHSRNLKERHWDALFGRLGPTISTEDLRVMVSLCSDGLVNSWRMVVGSSGVSQLSPILADDGRSLMTWLKSYSDELQVGYVKGLRELARSSVVSPDKSKFHHHCRDGTAHRESAGGGKVRYELRPFGRALLWVFDSSTL